MAYLMLLCFSLLEGEMTNGGIYQAIFMVWGMCYVYAFIVGMFRLAHRERQAPLMARLAVCLASAILGPIFIVLDLVDLIRCSAKKVATGFITALSFVGNVLMDMLIRVFVLLFRMVFIFFPAR